MTLFQKFEIKNKWLFLTSGFALFSMFFGSGNLVFPITVGQESEGHYLLAALGILLTGVLVPFLGAFGMVLYKGDIYKFFSCFGKKGTFLFSFLALALMGPFGVLARCLTVAHGALVLLIPSVTLPIASFLFCTLIFLFTLNKSTIISTLGKFLTPLLLLSVTALAFFGLYYSSPSQTITGNDWDAFKNGFFQGYQTMDLLAAFFFSQFMITDLNSKLTHEEEGEHKENLLLQLFCKSSLIGAGLLSGVYFALVLLGWHYSTLLENVLPQEMLGVIAMRSLSTFAVPCVSLAIIFACLTTAVVLTSLFADFLRIEVSNKKMNHISALLVTLLIGFFVSTFDFAGIAKFLGPLLEAIYPALIILTLFNIGSKFLGYTSTHWPFTLSLVAKFCMI